MPIQFFVGNILHLPIQACKIKQEIIFRAQQRMCTAQPRPELFQHFHHCPQCWSRDKSIFPAKIPTIYVILFIIIVVGHDQVGDYTFYDLVRSEFQRLLRAQSFNYLLHLRQINIMIFDVILVKQKLQNEFRNILRILFITHLIILSNSNSSHDHDEHLQFSQLNFLTLHVLSDIYCVPLSQQTANLQRIAHWSIMNLKSAINACAIDQIDYLENDRQNFSSHLELVMFPIFCLLFNMQKINYFQK